MTQPPPPAAVNPYPAEAAPDADFGRIGFVIAVVAVGLTVVQQIFFAFLPVIQQSTGSSPASISLWIGVFGFVHALISVMALLFGIIGARRGRSLVRSGIAIGVGGAGALAGVIGLLVPLFSWVYLSGGIR